MCSQGGITANFPCALALTWFLSGTALNDSAPAPGKAHIILSRVVTRIFRAHGESMNMIPRCSTPDPASNLPADSGSASASKASPGRRYRGPSKGSHSISLAGVMTPVSSQGGDCKENKPGRTKQSSGPLCPPPPRCWKDSRALLQTRISVSADHAARRSCCCR